MNTQIRRAASTVLSLALILMLGLPALAQRSVMVPAGTVIPLRMETYLSSESSRVGDRFNATVFRSVVVNGQVVVPEGARVEGHVTGAEPSSRTSKAGTIAVAFDRLIYPNGASVPVDGTLTTLSDENRARLEDIDEEDRVEGTDRTRRAIVFIGGGAGAGAIIGAVAGGAKGAAVGAGIGAVLGTIGVLLGKGDKAEVTPGTEFGMYVERSFNVNTETMGVAGDRYTDSSYNSGYQDSTVFTSSDSIRSAQVVLRDRGYYNGAINGVLNPATRNALRQFQRDRNLSVTGDIDLRTAQALGIASDAGLQTTLVEISNPRVERIGNNSVRIMVDATTRSGGWRVYTDHFVSGNTLHVYVRGVPPRNVTTQAIDNHPITEVYNDAGGATRAIFHGAQRDITVEIMSAGAGGGFPGTGGAGVGNARQIAFLTDRLMNSYMADLNIRNTRGQVTFNRNQNFRQNQIELLFHIRSLQAAADLYNRLVGTVDNPEVLRGAADSLIRQARLVNRLMRRVDQGTLSTTVRNDWDLLQSEMRQITVTNNDLNLDNER